MIRTYP